MKKRILAALLLAAMLLSMLAACGGNSDTPDTTGAAEASSFKVGAIYINSKNDTAGYTYAHHNGITTAMKELGMDVETQLVIVDEVPEDREQVLAAVDTLVGEGADIIFGISFGYIDAMAEAAETYPDVIFSHGTGYKANETNFNNYFGRIYQARYLAGIAAGLKSLETGNNNVGYVAAHTTDYAETASGINGFALGGGCELSMSCDIRICSDTAVFGQPEVGLGVTPGFGGTQRLARLVSPGMAKQLLYTAKNIKADEALRIGLVNAVYPAEELMAAAEKMAETIAKNAPIAVRACKKAINEGLDVDMDAALVIEEKLFGSCFETADQAEGMGAFLEKRKHEPYQNK